MTEYPPTVIVVHQKERRSKCSVQHLRATSGFQFRKYPSEEPLPSPEEYVRLGLGGPCLSKEDSRKGLLLLDGTWRWTERMEKDYEQFPARSLPVVRTAYPRVSKTFDDPKDGLATIEALYVAYRILHREAEYLLSEYRWREKFLNLNRDLLDETGHV